MDLIGFWDATLRERFAERNRSRPSASLLRIGTGPMSGCVDVIPTGQLRGTRSGCFRPSKASADASTDRISGRLGSWTIRLVPFVIFDVVTDVATQRAGRADC